MPRFAAVLSAAVLAAFLLPGVAHTQGTLQGIVRDDSTTRPIPGVEVLVSGTSHRATTNEAGRYEIAGVPAGGYQVVFRMVGYLPARVAVAVADGEVVRVNQVLSASTVVLDPVEVTGDPMRSFGLVGTGFDERRRMGFGRFYDSEELREMEHVRLSDVLRRKGGVEIRALGAGVNAPRVAMHPTMRDEHGRLNCYMSVYLDGRMFGRGGKASSGPDIVDLHNLIAVNAVEAVEVYRGAAGLPIQFSGASGECGAVVLWTRRGDVP